MTGRTDVMAGSFNSLDLLETLEEPFDVVHGSGVGQFDPPHPLATGRSTLTASFYSGKIRSIHRVSSSGNWGSDRVSPVGAMSRMMRS